MAKSNPFEFPEILDEDLRWAAVQLGLPDSAFLGEEGNDPRKFVIQSRANMDVAACPGSGKTTVLIGKLAILAKKWKYRTRGICVLSHTNAARRIIENRLGNSSEGQRLLSYPHFIGTIHSFVNEFLASPWLKARGYPIKMIDTEVCESRRWKSLNWKTRNYLSNQRMASGDIKITDYCFNVGKKKGNFPCGASTESYKTVQDACKEVAESGYHCYDDMFVWSRDLLNNFPCVRESMKRRFPLLFMDEAQDNSDEQAELLKDIFTGYGTALIRQRFGDGNQAIYDFTGAQEATTDAFPSEPVKVSIPNSFRFGQGIAMLSDPLGLAPYSMQGHGPKLKTLASGQSECCHTIFVFEDSNITKVLDAYGNLLLNTFTDEELLQGESTAVGMVHRHQDDDGVSKYCPHRVGDYWNSYNPKLTGVDPRPQTFVQYVDVGLTASHDAREAHFAVERAAQGILRLAAIAGAANEYGGRKHKHRCVLEALKDLPQHRVQYVEFLVSVVARQEGLSEDAWKSKWQKVICGIASKICGVELKGADVESFLSWGEAPVNSNGMPAAKGRNDNVYTHRRQNREVAIKLGSIHSVKGQTHTATLVLETAWYGYNLQTIKTWLSGDSTGKSRKSGVQEITRLKTHYVAMTRPSHLLCLALHKNALCATDGQLDPSFVEKLKKRKWRVVDAATGLEL
jgi:DNA helicase II / ATP-dependent DNA helicase PcrA